MNRFKSVYAFSKCTELKILTDFIFKKKALSAVLRECNYLIFLTESVIFFSSIAEFKNNSSKFTILHLSFYFILHLI